MDAPMRARALALAASIAAASCAHGGPKGFVCPAHGGPGWRELATPHFLLRTDLSAEKARALARDLETTYEVVYRGLGRAPAPEARVRVRVVAFRSAREYDEFAPPKVDAYYFVSSFGEPVMVLPGTFGPTQRMVLAHEITHHLSRATFARVPHWLFEGLATYMETVGWSGRGRVPTLGGIAWHRLAELRPYTADVREILAPDARIDTAREYALSWALVHFLQNEHADAFDRFQERLVLGEDPRAAWRAEFPQWDPDRPKAAEALNLELAAHLTRAHDRARVVKFRDAPPIRERALSPAEAHDTRLAIPRLNRGRPLPHAEAMVEILEALEEDPGGVAALAALAEHSPPPVDPGALALRATEVHPEDFRAWLFLAQETPPEARAAREASYRNALRAEPTNPIALNNLAWLLVEERRFEDALPNARRAVAIAPWQPALVDTLAAVLEGMGRCGEALRIQRRAVEAISGESSEQRRKPYVERLARLEATCGGLAPAQAVAPQNLRSP
jgi:tetratricopeptide (TPR) repeat protein